MSGVIKGARARVSLYLLRPRSTLFSTASTAWDGLGRPAIKVIAEPGDCLPRIMSRSRVYARSRGETGGGGEKTANRGEARRGPLLWNDRSFSKGKRSSTISGLRGGFSPLVTARFTVHRCVCARITPGEPYERCVLAIVKEVGNKTE